MSLLIAFKEKINGNEEAQSDNISCIQQMHSWTDGDQHEINSCLHGSPHTDNAELVVQLYQKVADGCVNQKADDSLCPSRKQEVVGGWPKGGAAFDCC